MRRSVSLVSISLWIALAAPRALPASTFRSAWDAQADRVWLGSDYWANPLQDWRLRDGRAECHVSGGDRNLHLLTHEAAARPGAIETSVLLGRLDDAPLGEGFVGFRVGIRGNFDDYRDSAVRGAGLNAGVTADGRLFIGTLEEGGPRVPSLDRDLTLRLRAERAESDLSRLTLTARDGSGPPVRLTRDDVPTAWLAGGLALVCHAGEVRPSPETRSLMADFGQRPGTDRGGSFRFWFADWAASGSRLEAHPERAFGPILFSLHTLSHGVLKLTAQLAPVDDPAATVALEIADESEPEGWRRVATAPVDPLARTATFRVPDWDDASDVRYQVVFDGKSGSQAWQGTVRRDPKEADRIVMAAFTGNNDLGFPHADVVRNVRHFDPDLLVFTGDNIYEGVGGYGIEREPLATATLDYLRKWYLFGWEYRELLRDVPAVCLTDDHDVYQGNIWGAGGRHASRYGKPGQDEGGYTMDAAWVKAVQRTQTAHMPDPHDPEPVEQGIGVYFTHLLYGGLSVAVLEDRKWKSAPAVVLPQAEIENGWAKNPAYDPVTEGDPPGAELLGPRQERFLDEWTADWSHGAWMKVVASQTLFANVATLPPPADTDDVTPQLRVMQPGEYAEGETPVADHDSNGWPRTPRDRALEAMRRGLAFHVAGDQHLGSTVQYGIDDWNDAAWAICVPSVANVWPRRWYPSQPGANRPAGAPRYAGEFRDGFGNRVTVHAVSNPIVSGAEPAALFDRAPGYGIISLDRAARRITMANWPRWVDASRPGAEPYPGWPIAIEQSDNGLPDGTWRLPEVSVPGLQDPVLEVVDASSGERIYTFRIRGAAIAAPVPGPGTYRARLFDPDVPGSDRTFDGLSAERVPASP